MTFLPRWLSRSLARGLRAGSGRRGPYARGTMEPSAPHHRRRFCIAVAGCAAAPVLAANAPGDAATKADYLYRFLGFVEWPARTFADAEAPQVVALMRADDVAAALEQRLAARGAAPGNRRVVVRRVTAGDALYGVHLLHIGRGARPLEPALLPALPILVVTDAPTGMPDYAAVNFVSVDRRVRFEASPAAAARAGLKLSARLLAVTARVIAP